MDSLTFFQILEFFNLFFYISNLLGFFIWIFFVFFWNFLRFFGFFLDFQDFWIFFFYYYFFRFLFFKLLRLLLKVTKVTTGNQKWPKKHNKVFFSPKGKKSLGRSPLQELEVGPRSGPYLLV